MCPVPVIIPNGCEYVKEVTRVIFVSQADRPLFGLFFANNDGAVKKSQPKGENSFRRLLTKSKPVAMMVGNPR